VSGLPVGRSVPFEILQIRTEAIYILDADEPKYINPKKESESTCHNLEGVPGISEGRKHYGKLFDPRLEVLSK
jgi:hypothetical protein